MGRVALAFLLGACCIHCSAAACRTGTARVGLLAAALALAFVGRFKLVAGLLAGLGWAWLSAAGRTAGDLPPALEGQDLLVRGYVASLPARSSRRFAIPARCHAAARRRPAADSPRRGIAAPRVPAGRRAVAARRTPEASQRIRESRRLRLRSAAVSRRHRRDRLCARRRAQRAARAAASLRYAVTRARGWISARIRAAVRDPHVLGVLQGLAIGDTQAMTPEQWRVFAATGTTHLMAISGLAHQHGRGAGRVARRRDRAAAVCAGTPLERDARPGDRRHDGGARVFDARRAFGADAAHAADAVHLFRRALVSASSSRSRKRSAWR